MKTTMRMMAIGMMYVLLAAGIAAADDPNISIDNKNKNVNTNNVNVNTKANAISKQNQNQNQQQQQQQQQKQNQSIESSDNNTGNATVTAPREFLNPVIGLAPNLPNGPDTRGYHRPVQGGSIGACLKINQRNLNNMVKFLDKAHDMDDNTRTWKDMREDLIVQPMFLNPGNPFGNEDYVSFVSADRINLSVLLPEDIVGFVIVRDDKPRDNPIDEMYLAAAAYPYAKAAGVTVMVKADEYFWGKVNSNSFGAGVGSALSTFMSTMTGGAFSASGGFGTGSAGEKVAGGKKWLALNIPVDPCVPPPPPVAAPLPPPPQIVVAPPPTPPAAECPKPKQVCDIAAIKELIKQALEKVKGCTTFCYDNMTYRRCLYEYNIQLYACTHQEGYLLEAIRQLGILERNYKYGGRSISDHQAEADAILSKAYYDWAICIKITKGEKAVRKFIKDHNLDIDPDTLPADFTP